MKRSLLIVYIFLGFISGCETLNIEEDKPNAIIIKPGRHSKIDAGKLTEDGTLIYPIGSAFGHGGIADPNIGMSHTTGLFREKYEDYTDIPDTERAIVTIIGFQQAGINYSEPGQSIDNISIRGLDVSLNLGEELHIPLSMGNIEGEHELIRSVKINDYQISSSVPENTHIDIVITSKAGDIINIHFGNQEVLHDGLL